MSKFQVKFPITDNLANRAINCAKQIKNQEDKKEHSTELVEVINQLINHGLKYFFIRPVTEGNFGFIIRNLVSVTIRTTEKTATSVVPRVIKKLNNAQLDYLADFILDILEQIENN